MNEEQLALLEQSIGQRPSFSQQDLNQKNTIFNDLRDYYARKYPTTEDAIQVL